MSSEAAFEFTINLRAEETPWENAERNAIDALYAARDSGENMHGAGRAVAKAALDAYHASPTQPKPETPS